MRRSLWLVLKIRRSVAECTSSNSQLIFWWLSWFDLYGSEWVRPCTSYRRILFWKVTEGTTENVYWQICGSSFHPFGSLPVLNCFYRPLGLSRVMKLNSAVDFGSTLHSSCCAPECSRLLGCFPNHVHHTVFHLISYCSSCNQCQQTARLSICSKRSKRFFLSPRGLVAGRMIVLWRAWDFSHQSSATSFDSRCRTLIRCGSCTWSSSCPGTLLRGCSSRCWWIVCGICYRRTWLTQRLRQVLTSPFYVISFCKLIN